MPTGAFLRQSPLATVDRFVSASSEAGITTQQPQPSTGNAGGLRLRAGGVPTAVLGATVKLQRGGLPRGFSRCSISSIAPTPGASAIWLLDGDTSSQYRGHSQHSILTYCRTVRAGTATYDLPKASEPRTLQNGAIGFVHTEIDTGANALVFRYKSTRTGTWTAVNITSSRVDTTGKPALVVLPTGRLIAYFYSTNTVVEAWRSDDHGITWALFVADARASLDATSGQIQAEVTGDLVCLVTSGSPQVPGGDVKINWSIDGGQTFAFVENVSAASTNARLLVDSTGQIHLFASEGTVLSRYLIAPGGGVGAALNTFVVVAAQPTFCCAASDDGSLWLFYSITSDPASKLDCYVSPDNGLTWYEPGGEPNNGLGTTVFDNQTAAGGGTSYGYQDLVVGAWGGALVMLGISDGPTAVHDQSCQELWWGGWDSITEDPIDSTNTATRCDFYAKGVYTPQDIPDALGEWAITNTGAGATAQILHDGFSIVSAAGGNSYWAAATTIWNPAAGDSVRLRFVYRVNSGGSLVADSCTLQVSCSDTANRQWFTIRFGTDAMRVIDNSGTLATSAVVSNQFTAYTELLVAFDHDTVPGTSGLLSIWYRVAGATHWTALCTNTAVAELAASATEYIRFGGTNLAAANWDITLVAVGDGAGNLHDGFTNPDDLAGRGLSAGTNYLVHNGVTVGAFGGPGVAGDSYDLDTTYQFSGRNVWLSSRPAQHWRSAVDETPVNLVFGETTNHYRADMLALFGTNLPEITIQFSQTNDWGSPTFTATATAVVWVGAASADEPGYLTVDGAPFIPHQFRSAPGRRWYVEQTDIGGAVIFEILDNDASTIFVEDLDVTGTSMLRIFCDRMLAVFPARFSSFFRLLTASNVTKENYFRIGAVYVGMRHEIAAHPYDSGFVDRYVPNDEIYRADTGYDSGVVLGPERHELRIAWGAIDRMSTGELARLVSMFRALDGRSKPIAFCRDLADPSSLGLYRVTGPPVKENVYGEGADELARLAQLVLVEVTP